MNQEITLSRSLIESWQSRVLANARLPRGKQLDPRKKMQYLLRTEADRMKELWAAYTTDREQLSRYLNHPKAACIAYALGFHLGNCARATGVYQRSQLATWTRQFKKLQIIDLGCGTGAMSQSLLYHLLQESVKFAHVKVELVDRQRAFLDFSHELIENALRQNFNKDSFVLKRPQDISTWMQKTAPNWARQKPDPDCGTVILMGYLFNEIRRQKNAMQRLTQLFLKKSVSDQSVAIVSMDAGNESVAREHMAWRDSVVESQAMAPLYPCPHALPCPMLKLSRDWCYSEFHWDTPPIQDQIDRIMERDRAELAASAYVLVSKLPKEKISPSSAVVVGRPLVNRDPPAFTVLYCNPDGELSKKGSHPLVAAPKFQRGTH